MPDASPTAIDDRRQLRRFAYALLIAIAAGLGASSIWRVQPLLSANDRSRWATVRALIEHKTWQVDDVIADEQGRPTEWDTIDKVRHEGHFYSSKPALLPLLVSWVYSAVWMTTDEFDGEPGDKDDPKQHDGWTLADEPVETTRAILTIVNLIPWVLALVVIAAIAERYAESDFTRLFVVVTAALGTILSTFLVTLNNHLIAAIAVVFALYPAMRIVIDGERKWWLFATAGFFAAFACANDLPAALFGLLLFGLLAWKSPKLTAAVFVPAALIPLAGFFWANYDCTGGWKPFYLYYGTEKYEYVYHGVPSYWMHPGGLDANHEPPWLYLLHCTVGHHGLFSLTPVFLFAVLGWIGMRKWTNRRLQPFLWMGLAITGVVLGFYLTRTQNYNYGGNTAGLRWMFWVIPFWLTAMIPALDFCTRSRAFRGVAVALLVVSVFSATYALDNPWRPPWLYDLMARYKWIDYRSEPPPKPESPYKHRIVTWFPSLPDSPDAQHPDWVRFEGFDVDGNQVLLELRDGGTVEHQGRTLRRIQARWSGDIAERKVTYDVDAAAFNAGKVPNQFLVRVEGETRAAALTFLRGLPGRRQYSLGRVRYPFVSPLRKAGFTYRESAAQVGFNYDDGSTFRWRCDAKLSPAVPFGVLEVQYRVFDGDGTVISSRILRAVAASRVAPAE